MNKTLSMSEISDPPLLMLYLAAISLVFNLCFPQFSASASTQKQKFVQENSLKEQTIALKKAMESEKNDSNSTQELADNSTQEEIYSELSLEPQPTYKRTPAVLASNTKKAKVQKTASSASSKWVTVTAYSSTADQCDSNPFVTASGSHVRDGVIATNLLAFGTKVKFPSLYGDKIFIVEDRMNQRFSNRADIWFETREQAKQFGVRKLEMIVVS